MADSPETCRRDLLAYLSQRARLRELLATNGEAAARLINSIDRVNRDIDTRLDDLTLLTAAAPPPPQPAPTGRPA